MKFVDALIAPLCYDVKRNTTNHITQRRNKAVTDRKKRESDQISGGGYSRI